MNIFIDGSWLFKACAPDKALSGRLEYPDRAFRFSFPGLSVALIAHVRNTELACESIGEKHLSTSIFTIPEDIDEWPAERDDIHSADIENVRQSVAAREAFASAALRDGYAPEAIFRPQLKGWMVLKLKERRFQEKQVDATVVALLVRSVITNPNDYHVIVTGDADVLPAIRVAYPKFSENVFVATTHPDQLSATARQTSFALADFPTKTPPLFLDDVAAALLDAPNVYTCAHCNRVFGRSNAIPVSARPCCKPCHERRT